MENLPVRSYTRLAIAIVIAALIAGSTAAYLVVQQDGKTSSSCDGSATVHCVVFQQLGACSPAFWAVPWSVTIGGTTEVQPHGTSLPLDNLVSYGTSNANLSVIVFSLPDGNYQYSVSPNAFLTPTSGTVNVSGSDALVQIAYTGTSCVTTVASTSSMFTPTCVQLESEPLFLIVKNSSTGSPISSVPVQVKESTPTDLCSATSPNTTKSLGVLSTDVNGTIEVCCTGSTFSFNATYLGANYQVTSTAEGAESVQCVTLYIPSGVTTTTFSPTFQDHC